MADPDPGQQSEREIEHDAATSEPDPITTREGLEEDLMQHGASEDGEHIGEHID